MAYKFINMMMLFLISMIIGTVIASPVDLFTKSFENSPLKTALESINANSSNNHVYRSGKLIDAKPVATETNLHIPEMSLKNHDTNFNHVNGRFKRETSENFDDASTNPYVEKYLDMIIELEVENGYTGHFPYYKATKENIPNGTLFVIIYYKSNNTHMSNYGLIFDSVCIMIVGHPYESEIRLRNIGYFHCEDIEYRSNERGTDTTKKINIESSP